MNFSVTILGSGSALPAANRFPSAQLVSIHGRHYLVDCGEGTQMQLFKYGLPMLKISHLFISHLHADHVLGIFGLISSMSMLGREAPLHIYAPPGMRQILDGHLRYFGEGVTYKIAVHDLCCDRKDVIMEEERFSVASFPLKHRTPTCGFLFREKTPPRNIYKEAIEKYRLPTSAIVDIKNGGDLTLPSGELVPNEQLTYPPYAPRTYAYCSDTVACGEVVEEVRGATLLYHEATFADNMRDFAVARGHSTALQAAQTAKDANVKMLAIGHFSSRYKSVEALVSEARSVFRNTFAAEDGKIFMVESD
jgi:ribonuclease Z